MSGNSCDATVLSVVVGFIVSILVGGLVVGFAVSWLRRLPRIDETPNGRLRWFVRLVGGIERFAITLIAIYNFEGAAAFSVIWYGLIYATYWNRPSRTTPTDDYEIRNWARLSHTALIGYLLSALFALAGAAFVCNGEFAPDIQVG